ncbi:MAG: hypothetical protein WC913_04010, partial [Desulfuromonas sp.]
MGVETGMAEFHFLRPAWLLLFPLLALGLGWRWRRAARPLQGESHWRQICDPQLLPHILIAQAEGKQGNPRRKLGKLVGLGAAALFSLALAGPAWERVEQPLYVQDSAVVILLDLSPSMY